MSLKVVIAIIDGKPEIFNYDANYWKDISVPYIVVDYSELEALGLEIKKISKIKIYRN